ncbi:SRPBCC family protein [Nostocoides australiense]|uniref:Polyketide cyclase / dehydrase and lipid transport n=1 Tax=Nostocoides australiense Ben110 TaxID=1193182 RepID=W6K0L7_9MICO|nr:polyketide cyclase [Tetrasphaera australiensis]MCA0292167.1 polyketide cyclase [Actinomycetota bacterium]MCB1300837.1 polyketide cyclase [Tetrasphaera sp.]CCH74621.1 Polyketide cyclase / dehydrase and lipid transport [Tetrasphaera australiensis Ben110]HPF80185.1 polyketide cyclase [Tetrasphaera australiensis]
MTDTTRVTVERVIPASTAAIFDILSNPLRHADLDGSGFIRSDAGAQRIQAVGDVFTMNMEGEHMGGEYQTDNHVTGYADNALLAWQTAPAGTEPPGWEWVWELEPQGPDSTLVRHTYDWSKVTDKELLQKVKFPLVTEAQLEDTLVKLDEAATGS